LPLKVGVPVVDISCSSSKFLHPASFNWYSTCLIRLIDKQAITESNLTAEGRGLDVTATDHILVCLAGVLESHCLHSHLSD